MLNSNQIKKIKEAPAMPEIKEALVTVYASKESLQQLAAALAPAKVTYCMPYGPGAQEKIKEACKTCDVAIFNGDYDEAILDNPNIKWIHCCRAGVDKSAKPEIFERGIILTSSSGRSAPALAEHAIMFMLAMTYDLPKLYRCQQQHQWNATREYSQRTSMIKKTLGIVGLGKTGHEVLKLARAFDMRVLAYDRSRKVVEGVERVYASAEGDSLNEMLAQCDYVVLCVELNDSTYHMIGEEQFKAMKDSAYLINMGRGALVDEPVMIEALKNGVIAGAGLDTFEQEPLPEDSPLWDLPNVLITPHVTPQLPDRGERMLSYVYQNLKAYREGGEFVNRVTPRNIFSK